MKRRYLILICTILCFESVVAQTKKNPDKHQKNPFEMVHVSDTVRKKLYQFLEDSGQNTARAGMSIYEVLGKDKVNNFQFVEGIYSFKLMGPHFPIYYFLYTKKDGVVVIKDYTVDGFLTELITLFRRNNTTFTDAKKANYIEAIIHEIGNRQTVNGDSEILKKKSH